MVYAIVQSPASETHEDTENELPQAFPSGVRKAQWVAVSLLGLMAIGTLLFAAISSGTTSGVVTAGVGSLRAHVVGLNSKQDKNIEELKAKLAKVDAAKKGATSRAMKSSGKKEESNPSGPQRNARRMESQSNSTPRCHRPKKQPTTMGCGCKTCALREMAHTMLLSSETGEVSLTGQRMEN